MGQLRAWDDRHVPNCPISACFLCAIVASAVRGRNQLSSRQQARSCQAPTTKSQRAAAETDVNVRLPARGSWLVECRW